MVQRAESSFSQLMKRRAYIPGRREVPLDIDLVQLPEIKQASPREDAELLSPKLNDSLVVYTRFKNLEPTTRGTIDYASRVLSPFK